MFATLVAHHLVDDVVGEGVPITAVHGKSIEHVHDSAYTCLDRDLLTRKTLWVARPVPSFVVAQSDHAADTEDLRVGPSKDAGADPGMLLHDPPLLGGQRTRLEEDGVRNADLSDIMHGTGFPDELYLMRCQPESPGNHFRIATDPSNVRRRVHVFGLRGQYETADRVEVCVMGPPLSGSEILQSRSEVGDAPLHRLLELRALPLDGIERCFELELCLGPKVELDKLEWLRDEVVHAHFQGAQTVFAATEPGHHDDGRRGELGVVSYCEGHLEPIHSRHVRIQEDQVDAQSELGQGLDPVRRGFRGVSETFEGTHHRVAALVRVVDHEHTGRKVGCHRFSDLPGGSTAVSMATRTASRASS